MTPQFDPEPTTAGVLVVWDADGTLTRRDTFLPFLRIVIGPKRWPGVLAHAAAEAATHSDSRSYLKVSLVHRCLAGRDHAEMQEIARDYARTVEAHRCRFDAIRRWSWHHARGDHQILASASPSLYLEPLGESLGAQSVLATELQVEDGRLTGEISGANCRGREKARRIREVIAATDPEAVWVYSDSRSDTPSFDLADITIRVRLWNRIPALLPTVRHLHTAPGGGAQ